MSTIDRDPRVVSLLPAATEIVAALGVEPTGTSHACDYPPAVRSTATVVTTPIPAEGDAAAIDAAVRSADAAEGVFDVDLDALSRADPDVVITQGICDVCAVDAVEARDAVDELGLDADVVTLDPHRLADLYDAVRRVGSVLGRSERAEALVEDLQARVAAVEARVESTSTRPTVVVLDWLEPVMVAGHWIPELVEMAGGRYPLADPGDASTPRAWDVIRAADPDVLVAAPCGFTLDATLADRAHLLERPGFADLSAVRADRTFAMDGNHLTNRPGPRLVDTLEVLASLLHPGTVDAPAAWQARPLNAPSACGGGG